ncbi:hypothetical protein P8C59_008697 [Phyllachora maydis]|uniref:Uncharacterized protein n=1 Tax=Phyllachora maydis TaxID=1825666 RepID=A0AAD9IB62_9PEZI|nr:hypothetical protein P8C59_008697 [Phyllachora maydis]
MVAAFTFGAVVVSAGQTDVFCAAQSSSIPVAVATIALDFVILLLLVVRAFWTGLAADTRHHKTELARSRSLGLVMAGFAVWTGMSVPLMLGLSTTALVLKTAVPAAGLLILILILIGCKRSLFEFDFGRRPVRSTSLGKRKIGNPILQDNPGLNPLNKIATMDLREAAQVDKERRAKALRESSDLWAEGPAPSTAEAPTQTVHMERKEARPPTSQPSTMLSVPTSSLMPGNSIATSSATWLPAGAGKVSRSGQTRQPTTRKTQPPELAKTPLQRRPTNGLPSNPRARGLTITKERQQTILFFNNINQWHRRVGDDCPTFSGRQEKAPEASPLESPGHALRQIQDQLLKFEAASDDALASPSQRMALLENLEQEMGDQENQWPYDDESDDDDSEDDDSASREKDDDEEDDSDNAFDESTLWEIASLLKTDNLPSKNSLLPPAQRLSAVDDYYIEEISEFPFDLESVLGDDLRHAVDSPQQQPIVIGEGDANPDVHQQQEKEEILVAKMDPPEPFIFGFDQAEDTEKERRTSGMLLNY